MSISKAKIKKLLEKADNFLEGDFVLLGSGALFIVDSDYRLTTDIDLVGFTKQEQGQVLNMIDLAASIGLEPESINQSAGHYLKKQKGWKNELVLLYEGKKVRIYRPTTRLFTALKKARGTPTDLEDIRRMTAWAKRNAPEEI